MRFKHESVSGRCLGDFVVGQKIGEGGFGSVFRAEQRLLGREAVVKVLQTHHKASEDSVQRFLREAKLAAALDHPYAAHVYAFGIEPDGLLWIAMELVRGTPLHRLLRAHGPFSLDRFVPLLERICEVVHTAHQQGIVHRDLKPANVMVLSRAGRLLPKILDLGIARVIVDELGRGGEPAGDGEGVVRLPPATSSDPRVTLGGAIVGSPPYMAPEQWIDPTNVDARADEYALGVLTYEALTGALPFDGPTLLAIAEAHAQRPPPPLPPALPPRLNAVLARAMAKSPADRYPTVLDLATEVRVVAGLRAEPVRLPRLDDALLARWLASAPQPLAESVAAFDAARHPHHAREALARVVEAAVHFATLVALAARLETIPAETRRALRRARLSCEDWLELARELVRPFARRRDAFPIPELVAYFFAADSEAESGHVHVLEGLLGADSPLRRDPRGEHEVAEQIRRAIPDVARVLRTLDLLCAYPLLVARGGRLERWTGVRHAPRAVLESRPTHLADGVPVLADASGRVLLSLAPVVQIVSPRDGDPEEVFLLAGEGRRGARLVAIPQGLERDDERLWERLDGDRVHEAPAAAGSGLPAEGGRGRLAGMAGAVAVLAVLLLWVVSSARTAAEATSGAPDAAPPATGQGWLPLHDPSLLSIELGRDETLLITTHRTGRVAAWDTRSGAPRWSYSTPLAHPRASLDPTETRLVVTDGARAVVLDALSGDRLLTLERAGGEVTHADFTADGRRVLTTHQDSTVTVWDATTGRLEQTLPDTAAKLASPRGRPAPGVP